MKLSELTRDEILALDLRIQGACRYEGDCEVWKGYATNANKIRIRLHRPGKIQDFHVRRIRWLAQRSGTIGNDQYVRMTCGNPWCVSAQHMHLISRDDLLKRNGSICSAKRKLAISAAARKSSKLSIEIVREIRKAPGTIKEIGKTYGISFQAVSAIRRGKYWRETDSGIGRMAA